MNSAEGCDNLTPGRTRLPYARGAGFAVAGIVFAVFCQCIFFDFVGWDDALVIAANPLISHPTWQSVWFYWTHRGFNLYQPVTYSLWQALAKLSALPAPDPAGLWLNPFVFHFAGLLLHIVAVVAVYGILLVIVRSVAAAALGAIAFAIHPLMAEPIGFIGFSNAPLAAALALPAVWLYLSRGESDGEFRCWRHRRRLVLAALLYGLSLLAKPTTVVIPIVAICLDIVALRRPPRRAIISILPWILITIPCLVWTPAIQKGSGPPVSFWVHLWMAGYTTDFYLAKIVCPLPLAVDYGRTPAWLVSHPITATACVVPAALLLLTWILRNRLRVIAAAMLVYLVTLLPNSGLVSFDYQRISTVADRYAYLALVAVALAIAAVLSQLPAGLMRRIAYGATIIVLIFWAVLTSLQLRTWRNGVTLFTHAMEVNPRSWYCCQLLSQADLNAGDPDSALLAATRSIQLNPTNDQFRSEASGHGSVSVLPPPGFASAWAEAAQGHVARGNALDRLNRLDEAADEFAIAVKMNPGNVIAATDLAFVLGRKGEDAQAQTWLRRALQIDPTYAPTLAALRPSHNSAAK